MQLPDLRILPIDTLVPHEQTDSRRVNPLIDRLETEDVLRNPPIVTPFEPFDVQDKRFVVLDGANRTAAFLALDVPHMLAQVVDYAQVQLHVWHHVLTACDTDDLLARIKAINRLTLRETNHTSARAALARREALAFISLDAHDGGRQTTDDPQVGRPSSIVLSGGHDLVARTELLNQLVHVYEGCAKVQRTTNDSLSDARESFPDAGAVVVFPRYESAEIIDLARTGVMLPAGITRHVLPQRALRLNYPMAVLRGNQPLAQKQAHLSEWIHERVQSRHVRTYVEPTVLFDE